MKFVLKLKFNLKIYIIFLAVTFLWTLSIYLIPAFESFGGVWERIADYGYVMFASTCHQIDDRSFFVFGNKMAVCSRCASVYTAFLAGVVLYPFVKGLENKKLPSIWILIIFALLLFADAALDVLRILENTFVSRAVTGSLIGFLLPFYLIPGSINFANEIYDKYQNKLNGKKR
ncbi:MAG: DUF2085 domain-containing protein [Ignavibacteriota bacterium]